MKKAIRKSVKTSWRLPETVFSPRSLVWITRVLLVVLSLAIVVNSYTTTLLFFDTVTAIFVAIIVTIIFLILLSRIFISEYAQVQELEENERKVSEFFTKFHRHTDIQLAEYAKNQWVAYGDVPRKKLISEVTKVMKSMAETDPSMTITTPDFPKIEYKFAKFTHETGEDQLHFSSETSSHSFPVTTLDMRA